MDESERMCCGVVNSLYDVGYEKELEEADLSYILENWVQYSHLICWICVELKSVMKIDEDVGKIKTESDVSGFQLELSSLLKELGCIYSNIMDGNLNARFDTPEKRLTALSFLLSELRTSRILYVAHPKQPEIKLDESRQAKLLQEILVTLGLGPTNISIPEIFSEIQKRTSEVKEKWKAAGIESAPVFNGLLSEKQWAELQDLNNQFNSEYEIRRKMLLQRLDVTIDSFHWSDRLGEKRGNMATIFKEHRSHMNHKPNVKLSDLLASRADMAIIHKTSSASVRRNTKSSVNSVTIGRVPDRGGRPSEASAPPPEMPSWQQRRGGPAGSVGWTPRGGGRGGGDRGGRGGGPNRGHNQYTGGGGQGSGRGRGGQGHYGTNEGWHEGGGRGGYQNEHDQRDNDQGGHQQNYRRGGRGARSRVQGGWSNY